MDYGDSDVAERVAVTLNCTPMEQVTPRRSKVLLVIPRMLSSLLFSLDLARTIPSALALTLPRTLL